MTPLQTVTYNHATLTASSALFDCINNAYTVEKHNGPFAFKNCDRFLSITQLTSYFLTGYFLCVYNQPSNELVGTIYYTTTQPKATFGPLAVNPLYQHQSIGSTLINTVESICQLQGCKTIEIAMASARSDLLPFYQHLGYCINKTNLDPALFNLTSNQLTQPITFLTLIKSLTN